MQLNSLSGKRILIAEDEPLIAIDHAALLMEAGAEIAATCATGREAMVCIREIAIDVAVVDFVLADGNSEALQGMLRGRHIPFVIVSAYPRALIRTESGQEILQKPVSRELLYDRVCAACRRKM